MVRILVSKSIPMVHHVTIPCLESLLVSSSVGAIAMKMSKATTLATLFVLLRMVFNFPAYFVSLNIPLPVGVSFPFEARNYFTNGCFLCCSPRNMILQLLCNPLICIGTAKCLFPLHHFDALECKLGLFASNFLFGEEGCLFPLSISMESSQESFIPLVYNGIGDCFIEWFSS